MASIRVPNETEASFTRTTRDGRTLRYEMKVGGTVAKSSADRRPVDPPPVVELKIFDAETKNDVTFSHNANFFLYTTLESARAIAPIRGNNVPAPFPVLTGTPVAGMAYLDRPVPAGYFIFPDLSVRHEGKYRLSFNLYEELKEEKDADMQPMANNARNGLMAPNAHVSFRLEVKSEPFIVYSAKKFPGLAESTNLSRVVAEQGCRVRIRRDVRMRRRENKPNKDFDDYEDDAAAYRGDRFSTPDTYSQNAAMERARSVSASSVDNNGHQFPAVDRRASSHDQTYYSQAPYQQPPLQAPVPQQPINFNSHLAFGSAPPYQAPAMPSGAPQTNQPMYPYNQQQQQQQQPHQQVHHAHSRHPSNSSTLEYPTSQSFQQPSHFPAQSSYQDIVSQRPTSQPTPQQPRECNMYPAIDSKFMAGHQPYYAQNSDSRSDTPSNPQQLLPPLKTLQPLGERSSINNFLTASSPTTGYESGAGAYGFSSNHMAPTKGKRTYDKVFDTAHISNSVTDGGRPDAVGQDVLQIDADEDGLVDEDHFAQLKMLSYRRADGSRQHKKIPSPIS
ncbi:MAG: hypothetical protein LQ340_004658 [Diploschistes diacapsis]|nr:MAG: hypothetical protein LQ340_004658 [Diploschistes diacapsis]